MDSKLIKLRNLLDEEKLDAVFLSSLPSIAYLTNFSGFSKEDRDAFVLVTKTDQYIFTHGIYTESVKKQIREFTLVDIKRENPISKSISEMVSKHKIKKLGFEDFDLKVSEYNRLTAQIDKKMLVASDLVSQLRVYKSPDEIVAIKRACQLGDQAFTYILEHIKEGITENEIAAQLDFYIKSQGADLSFPTIVAFGPNAAHPHHFPTKKVLKKNNFVLMDFGVYLNNYCSDMTRTVSFGKVNNEKIHMYETVYAAQQKAIEFLNSQLSILNSASAREADKVARDYIISQGYPSMPHSLGHGIGLEVHEAPRLTPFSNETLVNGMVFSIEPGIYLPNNAGVRIEDLYTIQKNKLVQLTNSRNDLIVI